MRQAEKTVTATCADFGFPPHEEFKWSPSRRSWMHKNLHGEERAHFFGTVIGHLLAADVFGIVVMEDDGRNTATAFTAEQDVVVLLLERVANRLKGLRTTGLVVADRPSGDRREEDRFVTSCLTSLEHGTDYVTHNELTFVLTTDSKFVRLLQAADLATSCMTAYVAGEANWSPPVVTTLLPLFPKEYGRRAGVSIKIHPDFTFANLHHWLFGDTDWVKSMSGMPMPLKGWNYFEGPDQP